MNGKNETNLSNNTVKSNPQINGISNGYASTNVSQSIVNNGTSSLINGQSSTTSNCLGSLRQSAAKPKEVGHTSINTQTLPVLTEETDRFHGFNNRANSKGNKLL